MCSSHISSQKYRTVQSPSPLRLFWVCQQMWEVVGRAVTRDQDDLIPVWHAQAATPSYSSFPYSFSYSSSSYFFSSYYSFFFYSFSYLISPFLVGIIYVHTLRHWLDNVSCIFEILALVSLHHLCVWFQDSNISWQFSGERHLRLNASTSQITPSMSSFVITSNLFDVIIITTIIMIVTTTIITIAIITI